jgi:hypothetical protein
VAVRAAGTCLLCARTAARVASALVAAHDPVRFGAIGVAGIAINVCAGTMHFLRSLGTYVGDARPVLSRASECRAGLVHAFALVVLLAGLQAAPLG